MSTAAVSDFFAVLALGSAVIGVCAVLAAIFGRGSAGVAAVKPLLLPLALAIAATSTAGSLYYSEVAGYAPCEWCWYQRICMYPLVAILATAVLRRDPNGGWYALAPAAVGLAASVYHYQLQLFPDQGSTCDASAPCTYQWVDSFGFLSIPLMAACGFVGIAGLVVLSLLSRADEQSTQSSEIA